MSAAKRDNYVYSLTKSPNGTALRPIQNKAVLRPDRTGQTLALQGSWSEGTTRGSDPYNRLGPRSRS